MEENNEKIVSTISNGKGEKTIKLIKVGSVYYLNNDDELFNNKCLICGKERETTSHHIIPKRSRIKHPILRQLRIRICDECEDKAHPENIDIDKIVYTQNKKIKKLNRTIDRLKINDDNVFVKYMIKRCNKLEKETHLIVKQLQSKPRRIHPAHKMVEGRIKEIKYTIHQYKKIMNGK